MDPTGAASAMWVLAASTSKTPFYVAGGILAVWAVVLSFVGLRSPSFPGSKGRQGAVIATSALLVLAAMATAVLTSGEATAESAGARLSELKLQADRSGTPAYNLKTAEMKTGAVTIVFANPSTTPHNVTVTQGARTIGATKTIQGASETLRLNLEPGDYAFFCTVDGHRAAGMEGTITAR
jgi:plastocyanin